MDNLLEQLFNVPSSDTAEYNILFSDLFGTLIDETKCKTYDGIERECAKLAPILNKYLSGNNFLIIISSLNHVALDSLAYVFSMLSSKILPEYRDKIIYFMSAISKNPEAKQLGKSINMYNLQINFVNQKEEAIELALDKLKNYKIKNICAMGDSASEFELLNVVSKLGGYTCVVGGNFESNGYIEGLLLNSNQSIIEKIAKLEFEIRVMALISEKHSKYSSKNSGKDVVESQEFKDINEKKKNRIRELINSGFSTDALKRILYLDFIVNDRLFCPNPSYEEKNDLNKAEEALAQISIIAKNFLPEPVSNQKVIKKNY